MVNKYQANNPNGAESLSETMTRRSGSKKLTRQNPVIPPIKEGEELAELSNVKNGLKIERGAIFCRNIN